LSVAPLPLLNWTWLPCPTEKLDQLTMPVELDWLTVRLVGDVGPIVTFPLTTVPPAGSDCAIDGWAQPGPHNSAITLTEVRNSLQLDLIADAIPDIEKDVTINPTTMPREAAEPFRLHNFFVRLARFHAHADTVARPPVRMSQKSLATFRKIVSNEWSRAASAIEGPMTAVDIDPAI
jgi:hypothetical protein